MAFTASLIGVASGASVTTLPLSTPRVAAGGKIICGVCLDQNGFDDLIDSAGNLYNQVAGSQNGVGSFLMEVVNNLLLPNNSTITLVNNVSNIAFSARLAAISVTGLAAGNVDGSSAGQGTNTAPLVALDGVPAWDWCVGMVAVAAGPNNTFALPAGWSAPGNVNANQSGNFCAYFGVFHAVNGGSVEFSPTLLSAAAWSALMVALSP